MGSEARPSSLRLGSTFLKIGAVAFGGLGATLALIESELIQRQRIVSREELTEALTYTKFLPGSTVVQVVAYLGWRVGGWLGSAMATAAFLLPSVIMMLVLAYGYASLSTMATLGPALRGLLAAMVGLLIVATYRLARPILTTTLASGLALAALLVGLVLRVNPAWIVVAAGLIGLLTRRR
jgi:chromate transporter